MKKVPLALFPLSPAHRSRVFELYDGCYYIQSGRNDDDGREWMGKFPRKSERFVFVNLKVDECVKEYMRIYGIRKVRGGVFSEVHLKDSEVMALQRELRCVEDTCSRCGGDHHLDIDCFAKFYVNGDPIFDVVGGTLLHRLFLDIKNAYPLLDFKVDLTDEESILVWKVIIQGPRDTPYEGASLCCTLQFPTDFPFSPPVMTVNCPIRHPSVQPGGLVCMPILNLPNESAPNEVCWRPSVGIEDIISSFTLMLSDPNPDSAAITEAAVNSPLFEKVTNATVLEKVAQLKEAIASKDAILHPLEKELRDCSIDLTNAETAIKALNADIVPWKMLKADLESQKSEMNNAAPVRAPHIRNRLNANAIQSEDYLDWVVNLGFVNDPVLAMILSAACRRYMDCLVVKDSETAQKLHNRKVKTWSLDQMKKYRVNIPDESSRERTETEEDRGELPLSSLIGVRGNPRYLVNLIELPSDKEHLRDTVFHSMLGGSILFDDLDSAVAYRKSLLAANKMPPKLYTMQGDHLPSSGIMDPRCKIDLTHPADLDFIFGEMNPRLTDKYKVVVNDLELLDQIASLNEELEVLKRRKTEQEKSSDGAEIRSLYLTTAAISPETVEVEESIHTKRPSNVLKRSEPEQADNIVRLTANYIEDAASAGVALLGESTLHKKPRVAGIWKIIRDYWEVPGLGTDDFGMEVTVDKSFEVMSSTSARNTFGTLLLMQQYKELSKFPPDVFSVALAPGDNILKWEVLVFGPRDTLYEEGLISCELQFPVDFPNMPPVMTVVSPMWHPNVYPDGRVCMSILNAPGDDPLNSQETADMRWRPILSVEGIIMSFISMLSDPNPDAPANVDAAVMLRKDMAAFKKRVKAVVGHPWKQLIPSKSTYNCGDCAGMKTAKQGQYNEDGGVRICA